MKTRVLTALAIIAVVLYPVLAGGIPLEILALFIIMTGCWEWLSILPGFRKWGLVLTPFCIAAVVGSRWGAGSPLLYYGLFCGILWAVPVFSSRFTVEDSWAAISMVVLFSLMYNSALLLVDRPRYLLTICLATYGSDTGAYFAGRLFGKHKMNPRVSPKKSWEGFAGGWIAGIALSMSISMLYVSQLNGLLNTALCLLCPVFAELGDLCFSAIKRHFHTKDFSNLLPGHGGILDRVDSLLYNVLLFGILTQLPGLML